MLSESVGCEHVAMVTTRADDHVFAQKDGKLPKLRGSSRSEQCSSREEPEISRRVMVKIPR